MSIHRLSYPHIEKSNDRPARLERLPRIRVAQIIMNYLAYGWSVEEMCRQHPYLTNAEAHAAMGYYFDHQEEIDQEIREEWVKFQESRIISESSPFYNRLTLPTNNRLNDDSRRTSMGGGNLRPQSSNSGDS